jgi:hypothetical protein
MQAKPNFLIYVETMALDAMKLGNAYVCHEK